MILCALIDFDCFSIHQNPARNSGLVLLTHSLCWRTSRSSFYDAAYRHIVDKYSQWSGSLWQANLTNWPMLAKMHLQSWRGSLPEKPTRFRTKAFALQNGDESATKAHYIRLRVEKLQQLNDSKAPDGNEQPRNTSRLTTKPAKTSEETVGEVSLWSRLWARNIDFLICMALFLPVSFLISAQSESLILVSLSL